MIIVILAVVAISMIGVTWLIYNYRKMKQQEWALSEGRAGNLEGCGTGNSGGTNRGGGESEGQSRSGEAVGGDVTAGEGEVAGGQGGKVLVGGEN